MTSCNNIQENKKKDMKQKTRIKGTQENAGQINK